MRLSVSNIAWTYAERREAYDLMRQAGVEGLEIAPGLFFAEEADSFAPSPRALRQRLAELAEAGLVLTSMQALLFGVEGASLFGPDDARARFDQGLQRAIRLAGRLGIPNLVFGAPRQRVIPQEMGAAEAQDIAMARFRRLGDLAQAEGTALAIEANPADYGTNFLTHTADALAFVTALSHPAITVMLDTGTVLMNGETVDVAAMIPRLGHVHLSEPNLSPAPADIPRTAALLRALSQAGYAAAVSIEMKRDATGLDALHAALGRLMQARDLAKARP